MRTLVAIGLVASAACASHPYCGATPQARELCEAVADARVVCFGEEHDARVQHAFERETLEYMAESTASHGAGPLLLGMEMFQRPFQQPLDDYVAGALDEKEMLRRTEYFERWRADMTLYAPLWRFCRDHGVRIVALNAEASITRKVGREGLAALTPEERERIARDIDLDDAAHKERILAVFRGGAHPLPPERLEMMYQAMTVWDETMAETAATALREAGPGARLLVIAGRGHCEPTGIPARLARRTPHVRPVVVLGENREDAAARSIVWERGRFVVSFERVEETPSPKLGVTFETEKNTPDGLTVSTVVAGGAAEAAGVVAGDLISSLGGTPVHDLVDVRYLVDSSRAGDIVRAEVLRGGARLPLSITLAAPPPEPPRKP